MTPTTLRQIAETLGISIPTVSKALKDYPDVSKKTKAMVKELAKTLNYKPNSFAVSELTSFHLLMNQSWLNFSSNLQVNSAPCLL